MTMDHDGPEYGEPGRDALTAMVHRDARRDDSGMTGASSPSRVPLPAQVGAYRPRGPKGRGDVVFIREIPESLYIMIRDRLSTKQNLDLDGDLASSLSQSAVVAAWLMATLHTRPAVFRSNPHINRAADLLEDGLQNAGITARMGELSTGMTRAVRRLERMETLITGDHATLKAVEAVIDFLATWQVKPSQANDDRVVDRIDVTWPEAVRTGLRVRRDLDLPLDDEDRPIHDRHAMQSRSQEDAMEDDDEPSGPHVRLPGAQRIRRRNRNAAAISGRHDDPHAMEAQDPDGAPEGMAPLVDHGSMQDADASLDALDDRQGEAAGTGTPAPDARNEPHGSGSGIAGSEEPGDAGPEESDGAEPEGSDGAGPGGSDGADPEEPDGAGPDTDDDAGMDDPLGHADMLPDSSSLTDWLNSMDENEE